jgi:hypothetical protein
LHLCTDLRPPGPWDWVGRGIPIPGTTFSRQLGAPSNVDHGGSEPLSSSRWWNPEGGAFRLAASIWNGSLEPPRRGGSRLTAQAPISSVSCGKRGKEYGPEPAGSDGGLRERTSRESQSRQYGSAHHRADLSRRGLWYMPSSTQGLSKNSPGIAPIRYVKCIRTPFIGNSSPIDAMEAYRRPEDAARIVESDA